MRWTSHRVSLAGTGQECHERGGVRKREEAVRQLLRSGGRMVESDLLRLTWDELVWFRYQWEALKLGKAILLEWRGIGGSKSKNRN